MGDVIAFIVCFVLFLFGIFLLGTADTLPAWQGLVFFGGGVFWATNARPATSSWLDPRMVGWLAGVAGALFFAIAVYLLLQRLGRASEREARDR